MKQKIHDFFVIAPEVRPEFRKTAWHRNRLSMLVVCILIFGMELFNMARVLFWSNSGLGTANNRIYFALYCTLFLAAAVYLLLAFLSRGCPLRSRLALQYIGALFFLLWHVCMNAHDLSRNADAGVGIYCTAVLGLSILILTPAAVAWLLHLSAYGLFLLLAGSTLPSGDLINLTFTAIVALAISLINCRHNAILLGQRLEISRMNHKLQILAQRDPLTGLLNKAAFQRCVQPHLGTEGACLLIVDLDDFKAVNDRFGHPCGDFVLQETALRVQAAFPQSLGISRIGGDEFAVLVRDVDGAQLEASARGLIQSVSQIAWQGRDVGAGCSVGGYLIGSGPMTYEELYAQTDRALYQAKDRGKGQFCLLRPRLPVGCADR